MSAERPVPQTLPLIQSDIVNGSHQTFDSVVETLKKRGGAEEDVFAIAGSEIVQVDLGVGNGEIYRLHLQTYADNGGIIRNLAIWEVDAEGSPLGDAYEYTSYPTKNGNKVFIVGSSQYSIDGGDVHIDPEQLAEVIDKALTGLNEYNWKIV